MTFPDDCVQSIIQPDEWWVQNTSGKICRGALVFAFVSHVDQIPYTFEPVGRKIATEHSKADVLVAPLKVNQPLKQTQLPVAAMPLHHGEVWAANKAKKRPCIVLGANHASVEKSLTVGKPNHATAPTYLVAPFYGVTKTQGRAGYSDAFVERVRHCEYPQFHWDKLPFPSDTEESILRLDHLQPIGAHYESYKLTGYTLSEPGLRIVDDMLSWLLWGGVPPESQILIYRSLIEDMLC
ncbi:MAG: hypothetical protein HPY82_08450 [Gammaproteobacteria bacterium]|nr:hypothetical protein [Gammaproteobacteria bacterium]